MAYRGEIVYFHAFDIGSEIRTAEVAARDCDRPDPLGSRLPHTVPQDVSFYRPLRLVRPERALAVLGVEAEIEVRVYDIGVVSFLVRAPFESETLGGLRRFHQPKSGEESLSDRLRRLCAEVQAELGAAVHDPVPPGFAEAYTVFRFADLGGDADTSAWLAGKRREVAGLLGDMEPDRLSDPQVNETLRHVQTFERTDLVVVDWDAAVVVDLVGGADGELYVLELANIQLDEYRVLDSILDRHLDQAYGHLAKRAGVVTGRWSGALHELRRLRVDAAKLADEVSNITKFVGDWYLARVHQSAKERFHLDVWRGSIDQRLNQLDRLYGVIQGDVNEQWMFWMEVIVIVLIALEVVMPFVHG